MDSCASTASSANQLSLYLQRVCWQPGPVGSIARRLHAVQALKAARGDRESARCLAQSFATQ